MTFILDLIKLTLAAIILRANRAFSDPDQDEPRTPLTFLCGNVIYTGSEAHKLCRRRSTSSRFTRAVAPQLEVMVKMGYTLRELVVVRFNDELQVLPNPCNEKVT